MGELAEAQASGNDPFLKNRVKYAVLGAPPAVWMEVDHEYGTTPEPQPQGCPSDASFKVLDDARALRRAKEPAVARCLAALAPRFVAWSNDGRFVALEEVGPAIAIIDATAQDTLLWLDSAAFDGGQLRGEVRWPRGCKPASVDAIKHQTFYPCRTSRPDEWDRVSVVIDLATRALIKARAIDAPPDAAPRQPGATEPR